MKKFDPILGARSRFTPEELAESKLRPGPCAMGPTSGDALISMHVWVFQQVEGGVALASGDTREDPTFDDDGELRWKVRTLLDPGSKEFALNKAAVAVATAIVADGTATDILQWSQAVSIEAESPFRGNDAS